MLPLEPYPVKRTTAATVIAPASLAGVAAFPVRAMQAFVPLKETSLWPSALRAITGLAVLPAYPEDFPLRMASASADVNVHVLPDFAPFPSFSGHSATACPSVCVSDSAVHVAVAAGTVSVDAAGGSGVAVNASTP